MKAIDLFAGAGGFTTGATQAGIDVVWAANHWQSAVDVHAANHPGTLHACQDIQQADWSQVPEHDILLASPACQGHTRARGKERPHHDATRSTAWAIVSAVEYHQPGAFVVENVPEFRDWGPDRNGALYRCWRAALEAYGYQVTENVLDAADFGVGQNRQRLFLVGVLGGELSVRLPRRKTVTARDLVELDSGRWSPVRKPGRAAATLARIAAGRKLFGSEPFLAPYYGSGSGKTGRSLDRPLGTVTTRDRWALVHGNRMRMLTVREYARAMGFPADYDLGQRPKAEKVHLLGNAVCPPVAREVVRQVASLLAD
jgi:DNA (cytosine-5)-methyltransferase 1